MNDKMIPENDFRYTDSDMHLCKAQHDIEQLEIRVQQLEKEIEGHKEIRRMLDIELAKSNNELEFIKDKITL